MQSRSFACRTKQSTHLLRRENPIQFRVAMGKYRQSCTISLNERGIGGNIDNTQRQTCEFWHTHQQIESLITQGTGVRAIHQQADSVTQLNTLSTNSSPSNSRPSDSRPTSPWPTIRLADPVSSARYPLPVQRQADFLPFADGADGEWTITLSIPTIPADAILVASFVTPGSITPDHQFRLIADAGEWPLLPVPSLVGERPDQLPMNDAVSTHIDCWHTRMPVNNPTIRLLFTANGPPEHYLIAISSRPLSVTTASLPCTSVVARTPQAISQMTAEEPLRRSICSPTSLAMLLPGTGRDEVLAWTRDRATGMHGSWALAARAAALKGAVAAVELHSDWETALAVLRAGLPFAASIRFAAGELQDAPLNGTGGHLVVVYGIDGDSVLVHDPAADGDDTVPRRYDLAEFTTAWLASRGASYIIAP